MSSRSVKILAIVVIVLFGILYALNTADRDATSGGGGELLFPELKARLNDLESLAITGEDDRITIARNGDNWVVEERQGYAANTAALRQLLVALAEASRIEQMTANPSLYDRLGVADPAESGGDGVLLVASGADLGFSVILGDPAQGDYRYARIPDQDQSWLIDRNPQLPDDVSGWLASEIVAIESSAVQAVEIRHEDGESIRIHKASADATTFEVDGIPAGRELSYPTVVNSIAGVLSDLTLEDVAAVGDSQPATVSDVTFITFDGLRIDIAASRIDEETWVTVNASVADNAASAAQPGSAASGQATVEARETDTAESAATGEESDSAAGQIDDATPSAGERAAAINARTAGWRYRLADYKTDQLTRRWDDLLKAADGD